MVQETMNPSPTTQAQPSNGEQPKAQGTAKAATTAPEDAGDDSQSVFDDVQQAMADDSEPEADAPDNEDAASEIDTTDGEAEPEDDAEKIDVDVQYELPPAIQAKLAKVPEQYRSILAEAVADQRKGFTKEFHKKLNALNNLYKELETRKTNAPAAAQTEQPDDDDVEMIVDERTGRLIEVKKDPRAKWVDEQKKKQEAEAYARRIGGEIRSALTKQGYSPEEIATLGKNTETVNKVLGYIGKGLSAEEALTLVGIRSKKRVQVPHRHESTARPEPKTKGDLVDEVERAMEGD